MTTTPLSPGDPGWNSLPWSYRREELLAVAHDKVSEGLDLFNQILVESTPKNPDLSVIQHALDDLADVTSTELPVVQDPTAKRKARIAAAKRISDAEVNLILATQSVLSDWAVPLDDINGSKYVQRTCDTFRNVQY